MTYSAEVLTDSPLIFLRLGDASGTTAVDSSGNSRSATYTGSPTLGVAGLLTRDTDTAVTFNGTSQYASLTGASWMNVTDYTVEVWFNSTTTAPSWMACRDIATSGNKIWDVSLNSVTGDGKVQLSTWNNINFQPLVSTDGGYNDGQRHHVVATKSGNTLTLYIDGTVQGTTTAYSAFDTSASIALDIARRGSNANFFPGTLDEFAFYGSALSSTRITAHYVAGAPQFTRYDAEVFADSPTGYWKLNDASGLVAVDFSGNGRNGAYFGSPSLGQTGLLPREADTSVTMSGSQNANIAQYAALNVTSYTMEVWFKTSASMSTHMALLGRDFTSGSDGGTLFIRSPSLAINFGNFGTGFATSTVIGNDGNLHHAVGVYDGTAFTLYVDGVRVAGPTTFSDPTDTARGLWVGQRGDGTLRYTGGIEKAAHYGTALSAARIAAHYVAGSPRYAPQTIVQRTALARASTR